MSQTGKMVNRVRHLSFDFEARLVMLLIRNNGRRWAEIKYKLLITISVHIQSDFYHVKQKRTFVELKPDLNIVWTLDLSISEKNVFLKHDFWLIRWRKKCNGQFIGRYKFTNQTFIVVSTCKHCSEKLSSQCIVKSCFLGSCVLWTLLTRKPPSQHP